VRRSSEGVGPPGDPAELSVDGGFFIDSVANSSAASGNASPSTLAATQTVRSAESPTAAANRPGVLVVNPLGTAPHEFLTLHHACAVAKQKGIDVIELQFNGRQEERPIRLDNQKLTIRAAENYEPIVVFRPNEFAVGDSQPMFSVIGGQLTIVQVALEFDVPERMTQPCSLFETQRPESLRLDRCWLTIRNANGQRQAMNPDVAFFDIKAPPGSAAMEMGVSAPMEPTVMIQLDNSVARGEATLLRALEQQPVSLTWANGLLATSERLLWAAGGSMLSRQGTITIDLRHVTAMVRGGLCLITNEEGSRPLLHTDIRCTDSILLAAHDSALVEQSGVNSADEFQEQLFWSGKRYFYSGFETFWRISTIGSQQQPMEQQFEQWQEHWQEVPDNREMWSQVTWQHLPDMRPFHSHVPDDYLLAEENNKALNNAGDGVDAGMKVQSLPPTPRSLAEPATSTAPDIGQRSRF
jgi:hypothetical protein